MALLSDDRPSWLAVQLFKSMSDAERRALMMRDPAAYEALAAAVEELERDERAGHEPPKKGARHGT